MNIEAIRDRLRGLNINAIFDRIVQQTEQQLLNLNRSQLAIGDYSDGSPMPDYANDVYADFKKKVVGSMAPFGTVDLKVTGDFYSGFKAETDLFGISIESEDVKAGRLESKYGSLIYGLTAENLQKYTIIVKELMLKQIRNELQL